MITQQVEYMKGVLYDQWYNKVGQILLIGAKKKHIPDPTKKISLKMFFNSLAVLMGQNLSDIAIRSLKQFTNFFCDIGVCDLF